MKVSPRNVRGTVAAPPSKSVTIRALVAAALAPGISTILGPSRCQDATAALGALECLGAELAWHGEDLRVRGGGAVRRTRLDCGESALCLRMLAPVAAALTDEEVTLLASGSLLHRPMGMLQAPLHSLGARCTTSGGAPPVRVRGRLTGGHAVVDASMTSQLLTGLLFALPLCAQDSELRVPSLSSGRYVAMTLEVLKAFGIRVEHDEAAGSFRIPSMQRYHPREFRVEGDWSTAAFFLVAGAIAGQARVTGLRLDSTQADARIIDILRASGAAVDLSDGVEVSAARLSAFACDVSETPDLLPPIAALACSCEGTSQISGIQRTRLKESDRVAALRDALAELGGNIEVGEGSIRVTGGRLHGGVAPTFGDHRIAMAVAIAALRASGTVEIQGSECVAKSHPRFFDDLKVLLT